MKVAVVDIGTNSMRMLITSRTGEIGRWVEVTGLGRGVDRTGVLAPEAMEESLAALARFGARMDAEAVGRRVAIATSASRDAANREEFFDLAHSALGVRPILISGEEEARLAFAGATAGPGLAPPVLVSDIGGGSTEFVTDAGAISIDIGSVRLTERAIPTRPAPQAELSAARGLVAASFGIVDLVAESVVGVAGTWTSLAAIAMGAPGRGGDVQGYRLSREHLATVVVDLSGLTVEETAAIPGLDPRRAPVILAGSLIAEAVLDAVGAGEAVISVHDTLDGAAAELLDLR